MIENTKEDLTVNAIKQMQVIIMKFIQDSFKGSYFIKALECVKVLRDACITDDEPEMFNKFFEDMKSNFSHEKYLDFWKLVIENKVSLISKNEHLKSEVTNEMSENFLNSFNKKESMTSSIKDLDDLIADID